MTDAKTEILKHFPNERYKRFWYPTRPIFTLFLGLTITSLGVIGIIPLAWALWAAAAFALDDLPLTPILAMFTAVNNLKEGRKTLKAGIMIAALTLAVLSGGFLGYFVFAKSAFVMKLITDYITLTSCSPLLISLGATLGAAVAHTTHKIRPFLGILLGIGIASLIPFSPPLMLEIMFLSVASFAFVTSVVVKQGLRAYFKYRYGHTNADGYECARNEEAQNAFIKSQAETFNVTDNQLQDLAAHCKEKAAAYKRDASFFHEYFGDRTHVTNAYKDIYHGLMDPNLTADTACDVKKLIQRSHEASFWGQVREDTRDRAKAKANLHFAFGTFFSAGFDARMEAHQVKIYEGGELDTERLRPFCV